MKRARSRNGRAAARCATLALPLLLLLLLLLSAGGRARADDASQRSCRASDGCECEDDASCWDFAFLSSGRTVVLGLTTTVTSLAVAGADRLEAGVLASYRVDVYRARGLLNGHVFASGAIGAGSAGTEGALGAGIDFGVRVPATRVSGPVLRIGPTGSLLGHDALQLAMLEPLRLTAGYQHLLGETLLEGGVTAGLLGASRFVAAGRRASLNGSLALGHYLAAHVNAIRVDARVIYLRPSPFRPALELASVQLEACGLQRPIALCADARYIQSHLPPPRVFGTARGTARPARALYAGVTLGLTP